MTSKEQSPASNVFSKFLNLNPALRWGGFIVLLLVGNVAAMGWIFVAAGPADARRVIPNYYDKSSHYQIVQEQERQNVNLQWRVTQSSQRGVLVLGVKTPRVSDMPSSDAPVASAPLQMHIELRHRAKADDLHVFDRTLPFESDALLTFAPIENLRPGMYDAQITLRRGTDLFERQETIEVMP